MLLFAFQISYSCFDQFRGFFRFSQKKFHNIDHWSRQRKEHPKHFLKV